MKYIDAEKLKSLLRERYNTYKIGQHSPFRSGKVETLRETIELIDSLQQEWSEEDNKNYEYLHQIICNYINNPHIEYKEREKASKELISFLERLKYFRPQPKQEWSEEDEYVINKVLNWAEIVNPTSSIFEKLPKKQFIERLKSLCPHPHWKPSEDEMKALDNAQGVLCGTEYKYNEVLCSLIDDLEKL